MTSTAFNAALGLSLSLIAITAGQALYHKLPSDEASAKISLQPSVADVCQSRRRNILFVGDSITNSAGASGFAQGFPMQTLMVLGPSKINDFAHGSKISAHSGKRSDQIQPLVQDLIASGDFGTIVFEEGVNDAWQRRSVTEYAASLSAQIKLARESGAHVVVFTIPPTNAPAKADAAQDQALAGMNDWLRETVPLIGDLIDIHQRLAIAPSDRMDTAYNSGDGVHPNAVGHRIMAVALASTLSPQIEGYCRS